MILYWMDSIEKWGYERVIKAHTIPTPLLQTDIIQESSIVQGATADLEKTGILDPNEHLLIRSF